MNVFRQWILIIWILFSFSAAVAEPVRIGAVFSQTGIAAAHSEPMITMVQLAVEEVNQMGGLLDRPVQLILLDNQSTPIGTIIAAKNAIRLNVAAVVGAHWSSHSLAMAPLLQAAGIPMISPASTHPDVTRTGDFIFRVCFTDAFQGSAMARFAFEDLQARKAAVVHNIDEVYSVMLAEYFEKSFQAAGGVILADFHYRCKATDFSVPIRRIKHLKPDVIYLPGYTRDSGLFIKQARSMGIDAVFLGGDGWGEIETLAGPQIEGSFQTDSWHPEVPFPKSIYLQTLYRIKFHNFIDYMSAPLAYDAVHLLADAIRQAGTTDHTAIKNALSQTKDFKGATGVINFNADGDPVNKAVIIFQYTQKRRVFQKTILPAG